MNGLRNSAVKSKFVGKNGKSYRDLCDKEVTIAIPMEELETLVKLDSKLKDQQKTIDQLQQDRPTLEERYNSLLDELSNVCEAETISKEDAMTEIKLLKKQNENLQNYVEALGKDLDFQNKGYKNLSDIVDDKSEEKCMNLRQMHRKQCV